MRTQVSIQFDFNLNTQLLQPTQGGYSEQANVSHIEKIFENTTYKGFKGFHFAGTPGEWPADASGAYHYYPDEGYQGYISQALSNSSGSFIPPISISFQLLGSAPNEVFIQFDAVCNEFAKDMVVTNSLNSNTMFVSNNSYICRIKLSDMQMPETDSEYTITINIQTWNKPFKSAKITKLSLNFLAVYDGTNLIKYDCSENLFDSNMQIKAGICEQYADIEVYDRSGILHEFAQEEILGNEQNVTITAIDDDTNEQWVLGTYLVTDWDVPSTSSRINITSKDNTMTLDRLYVQMLPIKTRTVDELLQLCFAQLKNTSWRYIDEDTAGYCRTIVTPNSWCYTDTLLNTLIKVCLLGMLRIYWYIDSYVVARCY